MLAGIGNTFTNTRKHANITDMSDQRISGTPSGQWHNYSELARTQTGNNSVPSSSRRASTSQFGDLAPARQTVAHPPTLQPSMVSGSSAAWLHAYRSSSDPGELALAGAVTLAIQNGALSLGNPASQTATRAQYGQRLETPDGSASLVVNFRLGTDERFDLISAGMRDSANPNRKVAITAPQNASISGQAQPNPAPVPLSSPAPAQITRRLVQPPEVPVNSPSSQPLQRVVTAPAFSPQIRSSISQTVTGLVRWDQQTARTQIETKLRSVPANEQLTLLMYLNAQLSGKASDTKPAIIQNWAATATVGRSMEGRDMRTDCERELQNALSAQLNNPAFRGPRDEISGMLPVAHRRIAIDIGILNGNTYKALLYRRAFADSRGPVAAIHDIRALIEPLPEQQRYQAIKNWAPQ